MIVTIGIIGGLVMGFAMGLYIGKLCGVKETLRELHVATGKNAKKFYKKTGLGKS